MASGLERSTALEYASLLRTPKLVLSMFDVNPPNPQQLFQDWSVLHCVFRLFCGLSMLLALALAQISGGDIGAAFGSTIAALGWSVFVFFVSQVPWHCVVKRSGWPAYRFWAFIYFVFSVVTLGAWCHLLERGSSDFMEEARVPPELRHRRRAYPGLTLGPFLFGLDNAFMFIACVRASQQASARERLGALGAAAPLLLDS
ncbi:tenA [Symbiodinium sp. CCMP2456]|nr:tenA [Symbiodinium sp. CCMP2456]